MQATQICTFRINQYLIGLEVEKIQEVFKNQCMTAIPLAPVSVSGLINLRGQIVTAISLKHLMQPHTDMDVSPQDSSSQMKVVIRQQDSLFCLLVDSVGDVIEIDPRLLESVPANLPVGLSGLVKGIYKTEDELLMVLDLPAL